MTLPRPFHGIIPPLATPLLAEDRLDYAGLKRLVEHVLAGGVHGPFVLGSTGEGPSLGYPPRREVGVGDAAREPAAAVTSARGSAPC